MRKKFDEDNYEGIAWEGVAGEETSMMIYEEIYLNHGYNDTNNPNKIEYGITALVAVSIIFFLIRTFSRKKLSSKK